jgi:hypothetical protein
MRAPLLLVLPGCWLGVTWAQPTVCTGTQTIIVTFETARDYPSLVPIQYARVGIGAFQLAPFQPDWWKDPANYEALIDGKPIPIAALRFPDPPLAAFLTFPSSSLHNGSTLEVRLSIQRMGAPPLCGRHTAVPIEGASMVDGSINPSFVPGQQLNNGAKRDVGHLDVNFNAKSLGLPFARLYLQSADTVSSDGKDTSSKLQGLLGVERSFLRSWYIPVHADNQVVADQTLNNVSNVFSGGFRTIFPWRATKPVLFNSLVKAAMSPEFGFSVQYENRIQQDAASKQKFKDPTAMRYYSDLTWAPIHILTGGGYSKEDLSVEFSGKGWLLPNQQNAAGRRFDRLEGLAEVSLLIPVRKFNLPGVTGTATGDAAKQRIRFKYTHGANEANGFKHIAMFSLGYEAVK